MILILYNYLMKKATTLLLTNVHQVLIKMISKVTNSLFDMFLNKLEILVNFNLQDNHLKKLIEKLKSNNNCNIGENINK